MAGNVNRILWIDIVKYLCMMFVLTSHLEAETWLLLTFYLPIVLEGFCFASGYVYSHKRGFKEFFVKRVRGLLIPWLIFSILNVALSQIITFNEHASLVEELKWNFLQIREMYDAVWFIAALFVAYIPFYFFVDKYEKTGKTKKDKAIFIAIALLLALISSMYERYGNPNILPWRRNALPWHLEYMFVAMLWMFLGYLFRQEYESIYDAKVKTSTVIVVFLIYLVMRYLPHLMGYRDDGVIYLYVSAILGVFVMIYVSKRITPNKYMLCIGRNTLLCFALHGKLLSLIQALLRRFAEPFYTTVMSNIFTSSILAIILGIIMSFILIIPIICINRWCPFLIGRSRRVKPLLEKSS